jgi:hypothetical protein
MSLTLAAGSVDKSYQFTLSRCARITSRALLARAFAIGLIAAALVASELRAQLGRPEASAAVVIPADSLAAHKWSCVVMKREGRGDSVGVFCEGRAGDARLAVFLDSMHVLAMNYWSLRTSSAALSARVADSLLQVYSKKLGAGDLCLESRGADGTFARTWRWRVANGSLFLSQWSSPPMSPGLPLDGQVTVRWERGNPVCRDWGSTDLFIITNPPPT